MSPQITALRAIGARFIKRHLTTLAYIGGVPIIILIVGSLWLALSVNSWWWLLVVIVLAWTLFIIGAWSMARSVANRIEPSAMNSHQAKHVDTFIDKLDATARTAGLSSLQTLAIVIKDALVHKDQRTLRGIISDTASLSGDMNKLIDDFRQPRSQQN